MACYSNSLPRVIFPLWSTPCSKWSCRVPQCQNTHPPAPNILPVTTLFRIHFAIKDGWYRMRVSKLGASWPLQLVAPGRLVLVDVPWYRIWPIRTGGIERRPRSFQLFIESQAGSKWSAIHLIYVTSRNMITTCSHGAVNARLVENFLHFPCTPHGYPRVMGNVWVVIPLNIDKALANRRKENCKWYMLKLCDTNITRVYAVNLL